MQIIPKDAPPGTVDPQAAAQAKAQAARERAISRLMGNQGQAQAAVPNQSNISVEEAVAAAPAVSEEPEAPAEGQSATSDDVSQAVPEAPAPKEVTDSKEAPLSSQYAQLARKEKAIRLQAQDVKRQQEAFKQREEALKAREAEMLAKYIPKDRLVEDPWSVLDENKISYEQLTQRALNAPTPEAQAQQAVIKELRDEIKALKDGHESTKKSIDDSQRNAYTQAVNQIRTETKQLVKADENFETIQATNSYEDVVDLITKTFEAEGTLLTVQEAAEAVEEYLVEEAMKVAKLKKIQQRLKPPVAAPVAAGAKAPAEKPQLKTLTNAVGATRQLSAKERAILAFKGELKS